MATAREELHRLADSLPDAVAEELAEIGRALYEQARQGEVEEVTDPEEIAIVLDALQDNPSEPEYAAGEAKAALAARRRPRS